jgi:hypothetical protein
LIPSTAKNKEEKKEKRKGTLLRMAEVKFWNEAG